MGPPTDPGPSGGARVSKWSVHPWSDTVHVSTIRTEQAATKSSKRLQLTCCWWKHIPFNTVSSFLFYFFF
ncbi:unnamed protein product, partial [Staurois parvus]